MMRMYVWNTEFWRNYSSGMAVGVGRTVREARDAVRAHVIRREPDPEMRDYDLERVEEGLMREPDLILDLPAGIYIAGGD